MPSRSLKLLALAAAFSVTPAWANHPVTTASSVTRHTCPHQKERAEAAARTLQGLKRGAKITLIGRVPAEGSLLSWGRPGFLTP